MLTSTAPTGSKHDNRPTTATAPASDPKSGVPSGAGWMGALRDLPREHGFEPLRVEGTIPAELRGTLYRIGPSLFSSFGKRYGHVFDGDGAVTAVQFGNEHTLGATKLVQSEGLVREHRAGRQLYG